MRPFLRVKPVEVIVIMCQYLWGLEFMKLLRVLLPVECGSLYLKWG